MSETIKKALEMNQFVSDPRADDIYINPEDAEELKQPQHDNLGKKRQINKRRTKKKQAELSVKRMKSYMDNILGSLKLQKLASQFSICSVTSEKSDGKKKLPSPQKTADEEKSKSPSRNASSVAKKDDKKKRSDSAKRREMEQKLHQFYQSLIRPIDEEDAKSFHHLK